MIRVTDARGGQGSLAAAIRGSVVACVALLLAGCSLWVEEVDPIPGIVEAGEYQAWDEVRPVLKAYLTKHPEDPIAHYLYGLSYLHLQAPQLTLAEGEFLTTLYLLSSSQEFSPERIGVDRNTFAGRVHRKTALGYMRAYREGVQMGFSKRYCIGLLVKANEQVEQGLAADPTSTQLKEYQQFLRGELGLDSPPAPDIITERAGKGVAI